jgi:hypothetical protein
MELKQLKQELKELGFKVSIKTQSYGRHATYIHKGMDEALTFNVFTPERQVRWSPLQKWQIANQVRLGVLRQRENIYGLCNLVIN